MIALDFLLNNWETVLEIMILWWVYYMVYLLLRGTVAEQVSKGLIIIVIIMVLTQGLNLIIINWLLTRLLAISVIAFLIIFQPEIRRGLAKIGRLGMFPREKETLEEISKAAVILARKNTGGLIAIERETGLRRYVESGVAIDARVTSELINTIFMPKTSLHDGGIIVSDQRIEAAACLFPLTQNPNVPKTMGTRHRAAIGLSEETDAVVVVISEETGNISVAIGGRMTRDIEPKNVSVFLSGMFKPRVKKNALLPTLKKMLLRSKEKK